MVSEGFLEEGCQGEEPKDHVALGKEVTGQEHSR